MELAQALVPWRGSEAGLVSVLHRQRHFAAHPKSALTLFLYSRVGFSSFSNALLYFVLVVSQFIVRMVHNGFLCLFLLFWLDYVLIHTVSDPYF